MGAWGSMYGTSSPHGSLGFSVQHSITLRELGYQVQTQPKLWFAGFLLTHNTWQAVCTNFKLRALLPTACLRNSGPSGLCSHSSAEEPSSPIKYPVHSGTALGTPRKQHVTCDLHMMPTPLTHRESSSCTTLSGCP